MNTKFRFLPFLVITAFLLLLSSAQAAGRGSFSVFLPVVIGDGGGQEPPVDPPAEPTGPDSAWGTVPSPNQGAAENVLNDIDAIDDQDVWAAGTSGNDPLITHWDGDEWTISPLPVFNYTAELNGIAAVSTNDVWAVGETETGSSFESDTLIMHWDGTAWAVVPSPNGNPDSYNRLHAVAAVSADDVWAVGEYRGDLYTHPLILHWDGLSWNIVQQNCDNYNRLLAITVIAPDDIWTTGDALTCHYDGSSWTEIPSPQPRPAFNEIGYTLNDIDAVSSDNIWVVGTRSISTGQYITVASLAEHWNGVEWTAVYYQFPILGYGIAVQSADNIWAVGSSIAHWDGSSWSVVPTPVVGNGSHLNAVDAIGETELWAAGHFLNDTYTERTLIENAPSKTQGTVRGDTNNANAVITWFGPVSGSTEADMFGEYDAAGLPAGSYTFIASAPSCVPAAVDIEVTAGTTIYNDFVLDCQANGKLSPN